LKGKGELKSADQFEWIYSGPLSKEAVPRLRSFVGAIEDAKRRGGKENGMARSQVKQAAIRSKLGCEKDIFARSRQLGCIPQKQYVTSYKKKEKGERTKRLLEYSH